MCLTCAYLLASIGSFVPDSLNNKDSMPQASELQPYSTAHEQLVGPHNSFQQLAIRL